jgi:hypothetical protein
MKPLRQMAAGFYLIVFRTFSASFTGIIGRVVGFGGVGRVDAQQMLLLHMYEHQIYTYATSVAT